MVTNLVNLFNIFTIHHMILAQNWTLMSPAPYFLDFPWYRHHHHQVISNLIPFQNLNLMFALGIVVRTLVTGLSTTAAGHHHHHIPPPHADHDQGFQTSQSKWLQCFSAFSPQTHLLEPTSVAGIINSISIIIINTIINSIIIITTINSIITIIIITNNNNNIILVAGLPCARGRTTLRWWLIMRLGRVSKTPLIRKPKISYK